MKRNDQQTDFGRTHARLLDRLALMLIVLAAVTAIGLRAMHLDRRPMHTDEAVNAIQFREMLQAGYFEYDPVVRHGHGPALFYLAWPFYAVSDADNFSDATEITFRFAPVVFSGLMVLLLIPLRVVIGRLGAMVSAWLLALSPAFVFYGRVFIHETIYVFFILALIAAVWSYLHRPGVWRAMAVGAALALSHASKETCVIVWAALAIGLIVAWIVRGREGRESEKILRGRRCTDCAAAMLAAVLLWVVVFSGFFQDWRGLTESIGVYSHYLNRASGEQGHAYPWWQYFFWTTGGDLQVNGLLGGWWGDSLVWLLGAIGIFAAILGYAAQRRGGFVTSEAAARRHFARAMSIYTLLLVLIFSTFTYKTPWNALPFLLGMALLTGAGVQTLWRLLRAPIWQMGLILIICAAVLHTGYQSYFVIVRGEGASQRSRYEHHRDNPYVYGHTVRDAAKLAERIEQIAEVSPQQHNMVILLMAHLDNQWPTPWYLRRFTRIGYYPQWLPEELSGFTNDPAIIITDKDVAEQARAFLGDRYLQEIYQLRHSSAGMTPNPMVAAFIREDLFEAMLKRRSAPAPQ